MIGEHIRILRERENLLLRELAAILEIDPAMLSKMERGVRFFRKEDLEVLSKALNEEKETLNTMWLADKILKTSKDEKYQVKALELALINCKKQNTTLANKS